MVYQTGPSISTKRTLLVYRIHWKLAATSSFFGGDLILDDLGDAGAFQELLRKSGSTNWRNGPDPSTVLARIRWMVDNMNMI